MINLICAFFISIPTGEVVAYTRPEGVYLAEQTECVVQVLPDLYIVSEPLGTSPTPIRSELKLRNTYRRPMYLLQSAVWIDEVRRWYATWLKLR